MQEHFRNIFCNTPFKPFSTLESSFEMMYSKTKKGRRNHRRATLPGVSFTVCGDARQPPPTFAPYRNKLHPLRGRISARIWQSGAVVAREAHNLEVVGPSPTSATRAAVSPVTLSTAASAAMQAAVPTQGGHLRGEVGTLSLHQCESTTFSKIFFRVREPELQLGLICTQSYAIKDMLALWHEAPSRRGLQLLQARQSQSSRSL